MNGSEHVKSEGAWRCRQGTVHGHVDVWLRDTLASTYNAVLTEPLPDSWVRLIRSSAGREPEQ